MLFAHTLDDDDRLQGGEITRCPENVAEHGQAVLIISDLSQLVFALRNELERTEQKKLFEAPVLDDRG